MSKCAEVVQAWTLHPCHLIHLIHLAALPQVDSRFCHLRLAHSPELEARSKIVVELVDLAVVEAVAAAFFRSLEHHSWVDQYLGAVQEPDQPGLA